MNVLVCPKNNTIFYVRDAYDALMQSNHCSIALASQQPLQIYFHSLESSFQSIYSVTKSCFHLLDSITKSCFHSVDFVIKIVKTLGKGAVEVSELVGDSN
jgi:3-hydroxy-3-methylglutaryl CoA synthase